MLGKYWPHMTSFEDSVTFLSEAGTTASEQATSSGDILDSAELVQNVWDLLSKNKITTGEYLEIFFKEHYSSRRKRVI
jgi:hypothetical protein